MILAEINWLGLVLGAIAGFALGALWYGPFFGKIWMKLLGIVPDDAKKVNMGILMGSSFLTYIVLGIVIAILVYLSPVCESGKHCWTQGAHIGALVGLASLTTVFNNGLYEMRPTKLQLINGIYAVLNATIIGTVIGAV